MKFTDYYNLQNVMENLLFEFTVSDFKANTSSRSKKALKDRKKSGKSGFTLTAANWKKDNILLKFDVVPTDKSSVKIMGKSGNFSKGKKYKVEIQFVDVEKVIGNKEDFLKSKDKEKKIKKLIKKGDVKVWSNDLSFYWQGHAEQAGKFDYNIYPFPKNGVVGDDIWIDRHDNSVPSVTKHILEVLTGLSKISPDIAKELK